MVRILMLRWLAGATLVLAAVPGSADPLAGQKIFQSQCAICHANVAGGKKIGPTLLGIVGRASGTVPGFAYSNEMKTAGLTWTPAALGTYLTAPRTLVPGTKMAFAGIAKPDQRDNVIEYLSTLK